MPFVGQDGDCLLWKADAMNKIPLDAYLTELDGIPGWLYPEDVRLFRQLNEWQRQDGVTGDLLEIGAYQGKSAILLGYFLHEGERLVVCDLFEKTARTNPNKAEINLWYPDLTRAQFERNYLRFHNTLPRVVACSSTRLIRAGKLSRTFRFIHIDGSHLYTVVQQDLRTARRLIRDDGIVAIDDYRSVHTPGVAAAAWEAIARGDLIPFCLTPQKIYGTRDTLNRHLVNRLTTWALRSGGYDVAVEKVRGRDLLRLQLK